MQLGRALLRLGQGALWRVTHARPLGRRLVEGLGDADDTARTIAAMMLAKGGSAAVPVLRDALVQRHHIDTVLTLLGSTGDAGVANDVALFTSDPDPRIARAARDALAAIAARNASTATPAKR
jgi:hypothetical protein